MRIEFELRPLAEIAPWGKPPDLSLGWFALTDGFYRIRLGDEYLLNYSEEITRHWAAKYPKDGKTILDSTHATWVDYQVVRLWEDILNMLPDILTPLPPELHRFLEEHELDAIRNAYDNETEHIPEHEDDAFDREFEVFVKRTSWLGSREFVPNYLQNASRFYIWSTDTDVYIKWDNRNKADGIPVWSSTKGIYRIERNAFMGKIHSFNARLIREMRARVKEACAIDWKAKSIELDLDALKKEQKERAGFLMEELHRPGDSEALKEAVRLFAIRPFGEARAPK